MKSEPQKKKKRKEKKSEPPTCDPRANSDHISTHLQAV
jgi:hypothetical protein